MIAPRVHTISLNVKYVSAMEMMGELLQLY
jgi:hypothetical protein